jgi:hypothetical protein
MHITFNDGSMIRLMEFLREASTHENVSFLDKNRRTAATAAIELGIACIPKYRIDEIGNERRNGYARYGTWGESLLNAYAKWPHRETASSRHS